MLTFASFVFAEPNLEEINRTLAAELVNEGDYYGAAIEYRRLSLMADDAPARDGYRWFSAFYYLEENNPNVAVTLLDAVEQQSGENAWKVDLLRAAAAEQMSRSSEEAFYLNSILDRDDLSDDESDYVTRKLAETLIRSGQSNEAREVLSQMPNPDKTAMVALDGYMNGKDKSPAVGGWFGIIPGAGYAYAGEYANAVRSIILNAIFIYGMVDTAGDEEWGAFAAITFFEITWYTGSIYGGIDSSHRYNIRRKESLLNAVSGGVIMSPAEGQIPTLSLKFRF